MPKVYRTNASLWFASSLIALAVFGWVLVTPGKRDDIGKPLRFWEAFLEAVVNANRDSSSLTGAVCTLFFLMAVSIVAGWVAQALIVVLKKRIGRERNSSA